MWSSLTHNVIAEADGAEGDEGVVEALSIRPVLHITEQQRRDDQKQQTARRHKQPHSQDLHRLLQGGWGAPVETRGGDDLKV